MGSFFTNVQVRCGDPQVVARAIAGNAEARGMALVDRSDDADRSVIVLPPDAGGWIAVYDEATEGQDVVSLEALAVAASRAAGLAFSVLVHDSDVLDLRLFDGGTRVDHVDTNPDYHGSNAGRRDRAACAGDPSAWTALGDPDALREAWRAEDLFAERTLQRTCEILACDPRRAGTGYRYMTREGGALPEGALVLRFRDRVRPAAPPPSVALPALTLSAWPGRDMELAVGDALCLSIGAQSAGRASRGIGVRCWGSAIEQRLVEIDQLQLVVGGAPLTTLTPLEARAQGGGRMLVADAPDQEIPAASLPLDGLGPRMDPAQIVAAMERSRVHVSAIGRVVAPGTGELGIGLVPLERREASASLVVKVAVSPPLDRPLHAAGWVPSSRLRPLVGDRYLVGLVAIDAPRAELARRAREVLDGVRAEIPDGARVRTVILHADDARRPTCGEGKARTLLGGKRLEQLVLAIETEGLVTIAAPPFALTAGTRMLGWREPLRTPWLAVSLDGDGRELAAMRERWTALFDDVVAAHGGQAVLLRTGWAAGASHDVTPYEAACGILPGVPTYRAWSSRWVRVPGNDRLWLPRDLMARVPRARLAPIADLAPIGDATRITLRERARARALEEALADVLPTAADALAFQRASATFSAWS